MHNHQFSPLYQHNCKNCEFLETRGLEGEKEIDWYLCKNRRRDNGETHFPTSIMIGRRGNDPSDYWSCKVRYVVDHVHSGDVLAPIALELLQELGVLSPDLVICDLCGLVLPPDPKHPGYPDLHRCEGAGKRLGPTNDIVRAVKDPVQPARPMTATEAAMGLTEQDITVAQAFEAALIICSDVRAWADGVGSDRAKGILSSIRVQYEIIQHAIKRGL